MRRIVPKGLMFIGTEPNAQEAECYLYAQNHLYESDTNPVKA